MKIAVVGATGQTGQYLVNQALLQGHVVTALVRNPGKLTVTHENLKAIICFKLCYVQSTKVIMNILTVSLVTVFQVVTADIFSADSMKTHFKDQDVVMSCLGFPASFFTGVTGYTRSMTAMVSAMQETQVNRIITMTSWYTERKCITQMWPFRFVCISELAFPKCEGQVSRFGFESND